MMNSRPLQPILVLLGVLALTACDSADRQPPQIKFQTYQDEIGRAHV